MKYCQDGIEAYYETETKQYTYASIYGYYELQPGDVNGRPYFKMGTKGLWWDGIHQWRIGKDNNKGQSIGYAKYTEDVFCPNQLTERHWLLFNGHTLINAGEDLGVNCKYIFVKHNQIRPTTLKFIQMTTRQTYIMTCLL